MAGGQPGHLPQDEMVHSRVIGDGDRGSDYVSLLDGLGGQPDDHIAIQTQFAELDAVLGAEKANAANLLQVGRPVLLPILPWTDGVVLSGITSGAIPSLIPWMHSVVQFHEVPFWLLRGPPLPGHNHRGTEPARQHLQLGYTQPQGPS